MRQTIIDQQRGELNHIIHIAPIRNGLVPKEELGEGASPITYADRLRQVLTLYNNAEELGFPSVIRIFRGIHTAKWALIDGDTRLLLSVVFDGSWYDYLRALALTIPALLDSIWCNCEGWQPVNDAQEKLFDFIARYQIPTDFLYIHHPTLPVRDIEELVATRDAIGKMSCTGDGGDIRAVLARNVAAAVAPRSWQDRLEAAIADYVKNAPKGALAAQKRAFSAVVGTLYTNSQLDQSLEEAFGRQDAQTSGATVNDDRRR